MNLVRDPNTDLHKISPVAINLMKNLKTMSGMSREEFHQMIDAIYDDRLEEFFQIDSGLHDQEEQGGVQEEG